MPFGAVTLKPGVTSELTPTLNTAGYSSSQLGRFRSGLFEKLGGWELYYPLSVGNPRALHAWQDFSGNKRLAIASTEVVTVVKPDGSGTTITPQILASSFAPNFSTTVGSGVITIVDPNVTNISTLDRIEFLTPISVGGLILSGQYPVTQFVGTGIYRITAKNSALATATVTNGGALPVFTTIVGSQSVNVEFADHGVFAGDTVVFPEPTVVGGLTVEGLYSVVEINDPDNFSISVAAAATGSDTQTMNGGVVSLTYLITIGASSSTATGWGVFGWGVVPWGGVGAAPTNQQGSPLEATDYTLDNWGQTLIACPADYGIYTWVPGGGNTNLQVIADAPPHCNGAIVTAPEQILLAYGAALQQGIGVFKDPLAYAWSDLSDFEYWGIGTVNPRTGAASQAGYNRIPTGSKIVAAMQVNQQTLLWTDVDVWALGYVGYPLAFQQTRIGSNCGAISRHAMGQMGGTVFWQSYNNFFRMQGGAPQVIPCSVWDFIFQDLNTDHLDKCFVQTVSSFNEVWFFFVSASGGGTECDAYAKYNTLDNIWDFGEMPRVAGIDQSLLGGPIMATAAGLIYEHEVGYNAAGQPLTASFTTGYFMIAEGQDFVLVKQILPDFKYGTFGGAQVADIQMTFSVINFPGDTPRVYGPYTVNAATQKVDVRFRGRQMSITVESSDIDSFWRLGRVRYLWQPAGRMG